MGCFFKGLYKDDTSTFFLGYSCVFVKGTLRGRAAFILIGSFS